MTERRDDRRRREAEPGRRRRDRREEDERAGPRHRRVLIPGKRVLARVGHEAVRVGASAEHDMLAEHDRIEAGLLGLHGHADEPVQVAGVGHRPVLREDVDEPDVHAVCACPDQ